MWLPLACKPSFGARRLSLHDNSVNLGFCPFCPAHKPFSSSALASQPAPNHPPHRTLFTTSLQPHSLQNAFFVSNRHMRPRSPGSECSCFLAKSPCLMACKYHVRYFTLCTHRQTRHHHGRGTSRAATQRSCISGIVEAGVRRIKTQRESNVIDRAREEELCHR